MKNITNVQQVSNKTYIFRKKYIFSSKLLLEQFAEKKHVLIEKTDIVDEDASQGKWK